MTLFGRKEQQLQEALDRCQELGGDLERAKSQIRRLRAERDQQQQTVEDAKRGWRESYDQMIKAESERDRLVDAVRAFLEGVPEDLRGETEIADLYDAVAFLRAVLEEVTGGPSLEVIVRLEADAGDRPERVAPAR